MGYEARKKLSLLQEQARILTMKKPGTWNINWMDGSTQIVECEDWNTEGRNLAINEIGQIAFLIIPLHQVKWLRFIKKEEETV